MLLGHRRAAGGADGARPRARRRGAVSHLHLLRHRAAASGAWARGRCSSTSPPERATPSRAELAARIGPRTRAIVLVHLFGRLAEMDPILELATTRTICPDRGRGAGPRREPTQPPGRHLREPAASPSFPTKNLGALGDGGLVAATDERRRPRSARLRNLGQSSRYVHDTVSGNFRLDALQAALLRVKLPARAGHERASPAGRRSLPASSSSRQVSRRVTAPPAVPPSSADASAPQPSPPDAQARRRRRHVFHQYVIRVLPARRARRAATRSSRARGIETQIYYPVPLHLQPCFSSLGYRPGDLPTTERLATKCSRCRCTLT